MDFDRDLLVSKIPLFASLSAEERAPLAALLAPRPLDTGQTLFRQGDPADALYVLAHGLVHITEQKNNKDHLLTVMGRRGDIWGETHLLTEVRQPGTATAQGPSLLFEINKTLFSTLLSRAPGLATGLCRQLAHRLTFNPQRPTQVRTPGKIFVLMSAVPSPDRSALAFHLALSATEQTRRRVLLVDVTDDTAAPVVALISRKKQGISPSMDLQDFQSVNGLRRLSYSHPSGLEVISLSEPLLSGRLFGGLYPLVMTARQEWDYIFLSLAGRSSRAARALWEEADRTLYVRLEGAEKGGPLWRELEEVVPSPRLDLVELQRLCPPRRNRPGRFYIPWRTPAGPDGDGNFFHSQDGPTRRGLDRMARTLADLRLGLSLGAGAALGYTAIGVLRALERHGIFPDIVAGTSMGALLGSFYAAGRSVNDIETIALSITQPRLWRMMDFDLPWKGVLAGHGILRFLKSILGDTAFDQLHLPFACVATDIHSGAEWVLRHGAVAEAVRASISLPFFFEPFFWQGRYLVDGGLVNPVPTSIARAMGADVVVSLNITVPPSMKHLGRRKKKPLALNPLHGPHIFKVMAKTLYTMQYGIARVGAEQADITLAPGLSAFTWSEFHRAADILRVGEEEAERMMPKIKSRLPYFSARPVPWVDEEEPSRRNNS